MDSFKDVIFGYESEQLPDDLKILQSIVDAFKNQPDSGTTLVQLSASMDEAATKIDHFKAKYAGSAYSLAIVNVNMFGSLEELKFLLREDILGDPRTIFLASMRFMTGDVYAAAKNKILRESETASGASSCIDCYSSPTRAEAAERVATLAMAYLHDAEARAQAKRTGQTSPLENSPAMEVLRRTPTAFYSGRLKPPPKK